MAVPGTEQTQSATSHAHSIILKSRKKIQRKGPPIGTVHGRCHMIVISILLMSLIISIILYSLCRIPSRTYCDVCSKSLVFASKAEARHFEDFLSNGDAESIHRILKALLQRGEIDITESEHEIYVCEHGSASADHGWNIFRDMPAADHDPMEDVRNLSARSSFHPDFRVVDADNGISVSSYKPVPINHNERVTDDLFASEYDICELLENISVKPGLILTCETPS